MHNVNNKSLLGQIWKRMGECVGEYAGNVKGRESEGRGGNFLICHVWIHEKIVETDLT